MYTRNDESQSIDVLVTSFSKLHCVPGMHQGTRIRYKQGPPELNGHSAVKVADGMVIYGGESNGALQGDVWKYHFGKIIISSSVCNTIWYSSDGRLCLMARNVSAFKLAVKHVMLNRFHITNSLRTHVILFLFRFPNVEQGSLPPTLSSA